MASRVTLLRLCLRLAFISMVARGNAIVGTSKVASRVTVLQLSLYFALSGLVATTSAIGKDQDFNANTDWLAPIAGDQAGAEIVLGTEMAELFAPGSPLSVVPMPGDAGLGNIARLLSEPHGAFVSTDALAEAENQNSRTHLAERLEVVARLCPQEVHVVARADIASLADLAGKKVAFGPTGGSSSVTAARLFRALNIEVEPVALDGVKAVKQLKEGAIAALVSVGGKPTPLIGNIPAGQRIHLLPIEFGASLADAYLPTRFDHDDYPSLIAAGGGVTSVATGMVLLAAKSKVDPGHGARVTLLVDTLFSHFAELQGEGRHPKWGEINLAAGLPGWTRTPEAETWLAQHSDERAEPVTVTAKPNIEAGCGTPPSLTGRPRSKGGIVQAVH